MFSESKERYKTQSIDKDAWYKSGFHVTVIDSSPFT